MHRQPWFALAVSLLAAVFVSAAPAPEFPATPTYQPDTLTVTWHADPLTTMTIQWLGGVVVEGKPTAPDGTELGVWFAPVAGDAWTHVKAIAKKPAAIWYLAKSESAHHCIRHTITGSRAEHVVLGHGGREIDRVTTGK